MQYYFKEAMEVALEKDPFRKATRHLQRQQIHAGRAMNFISPLQDEEHTALQKLKLRTDVLAKHRHDMRQSISRLVSEGKSYIEVRTSLATQYERQLTDDEKVLITSSLADSVSADPQGFLPRSVSRSLSESRHTQLSDLDDTTSTIASNSDHSDDEEYTERESELQIPTQYDEYSRKQSLKLGVLWKPDDLVRRVFIRCLKQNLSFVRSFARPKNVTCARRILAFCDVNTIVGNVVKSFVTAVLHTDAAWNTVRRRKESAKIV